VAGVLAIDNGKGLTRSYEVETIHGGFRLTRRDNNDTYDIDTERGEGCWACTCADCTYRGRECKHILAVRAALKAIGQL
jgi:hypothetical protein